MKNPAPRKKCPACQTTLARCDKLGRLDEKGGYTVCPRALAEHTAGEFSLPWRRRTHKGVKIEETPAHRRARLAEAAAAQPIMFPDPKTGKRPKQSPNREAP